MYTFQYIMLFYSGTLFHGFQTLDPRGQPGFMLYVQTFGDLVTFNPHIHALVADGVFYHSGTFRVLPPIPEDALRKGLRHWVLDHLCKEAGFDPEPAKQRLLTCGRYVVVYYNSKRVHSTLGYTTPKDYEKTLNKVSGIC